MSTYTCITCQVAFSNPDIQRAHYKTDWHRYNLKRKVAKLPPVHAEIFEQKVLAQREQVKNSEKDVSAMCEICGKHFNTQNAYQNHLQSKKHKDAEAKRAQQVESEIEKLNAKNKEKGLDTTATDKRLHKDSVNETLKSSIASKLESRTPKSDEKDREETCMSGDSDNESDDGWDDEALGIEECLFCSMVSSSLEQSVHHMSLKHSFFIPDAEYLTDLEGLITYLGEKVGVGHLCLWCNEKGKTFHSPQSVQKHMLDKGHCKMLHEGDVVFEYADFYDYSSSYPDHEDGDGDTPMEEDQAVSPQMLDTDGFELVLPSGATVGHRSLMRYYRQNIAPNRRENTGILPKMLAQYKALGWTGATGQHAVQRVRDIGFVQRQKNKHFLSRGMKNNTLLQKHFRNQNPI
ncbi:hypothetical protein ScPMuIL_016397 [Solemya velum]